MSFIEREFKYSAENVKLSDFQNFCQDFKQPFKFILASGWDHFYSNAKAPDCFFRLRVSDNFNQLSFKRKTEDKNNFIRTEHNIDLSSHISRAQVEALCNEFGYTYNTSLFKNAFIYIYDYHTLVLYICYDSEMKETGRYIEIELSESKDYDSEEAAWSELTVLEKLCKPLGISPQSRIKKSLFEMVRKGEKNETKV